MSDMNPYQQPQAELVCSGSSTYPLPMSTLAHLWAQSPKKPVLAIYTPMPHRILRVNIQC